MDGGVHNYAELGCVHLQPALATPRSQVKRGAGECLLAAESGPNTGLSQLDLKGVMPAQPVPDAAGQGARKLIVCPTMRARGMCRLPSCPYIHEVFDTKKNKGLYNSNLPKDSKAVPCRFFALLGMCPQGEDCAFEHVQAELKPVVVPGVARPPGARPASAASAAKAKAAPPRPPSGASAGASSGRRVPPQRLGRSRSSSADCRASSSCSSGSAAPAAMECRTSLAASGGSVEAEEEEPPVSSVMRATTTRSSITKVPIPTLNRWSALDLIRLDSEAKKFLQHARPGEDSRPPWARLVLA